jgi:hypothetical protein
MRPIRHTDSYPFTWLDQIIETTLNPNKTEIAKLDANSLAEIQTRLDTEADRIWLSIKEDTFCLFVPKKVKAIVTQYELSLRYLKEQVTANLAALPDEQPVTATTELVLIQVEALNKRLHKRFFRYLTDESNSGEQQKVPDDNPLFKICCPLSVDQMGIILKAADEVKLIISRSISLVFRTIAPFLSSEKTKEISWNSMRSSTYHMEREDIEVVIAFLEKLLKKIKGYL